MGKLKLAVPAERIFLQWYTDEEVTWCEDRITDSDIEYVRLDKYEELQSEINRLRFELECNQ